MASAFKTWERCWDDWAHISCLFHLQPLGSDGMLHGESTSRPSVSDNITGSRELHSSFSLGACWRCCLFPHGPHSNDSTLCFPFRKAVSTGRGWKPYHPTRLWRTWSFRGIREIHKPKLDYFIWIDWDVPRRMEAKLAIGPLDIDSIVLLLSSSLFIHHCFGVFIWFVRSEAFKYHY